MFNFEKSINMIRNLRILKVSVLCPLMMYDIIISPFLRNAKMLFYLWTFFVERRKFKKPKILLTFNRVMELCGCWSTKSSTLQNHGKLWFYPNEKCNFFAVFLPWKMSLVFVVFNAEIWLRKRDAGSPRVMGCEGRRGRSRKRNVRERSRFVDNRRQHL